MAPLIPPSIHPSAAGVAGKRTFSTNYQTGVGGVCERALGVGGRHMGGSAWTYVEVLRSLAGGEQPINIQQSHSSRRGSRSSHRTPTFPGRTRNLLTCTVIQF